LSTTIQEIIAPSPITHQWNYCTVWIAGVVFVLYHRNNMPKDSLSQKSSDLCFIEIQQPKEIINAPDRIDCYVLVNIDPEYCGSLARELNAILPLRSKSPDGNTDELLGQQQRYPTTEHLKRIRRRPASVNEIESMTLQELAEGQKLGRPNANNDHRDVDEGMKTKCKAW
jgi:hypothetical protein